MFCITFVKVTRLADAPQLSTQHHSSSSVRVMSACAVGRPSRRKATNVQLLLHTPEPAQRMVSYWTTGKNFTVVSLRVFFAINGPRPT